MPGNECFPFLNTSLRERTSVLPYISFILFSSFHGLNRPKNKAVGSIHHRCIKRSEVNTGSPFRIVPHGLADSGNGDILTFGYTGPTVAGNISGQGNGQFKQHAYFLQFVIHQMLRILILPPRILSVILNDRQQVGRRRSVIFINDFLHRLFPFHKKLLPRFLPAI